jgi:SAM-dependent methyltransferase
MTMCLSHPLTRGLSLDDPRTTDIRRQIIESKPFLRQIYEQWYRQITAAVPARGGLAVELGSGAGFFQRFLPDVITSEVFVLPGLDLAFSALEMPFADASLRAITMVDVLHHLPQVERFFDEAARCLRVGGVVAMIEPWATTWSTLIYQNLHHEPFRPDARDWSFPSTGPLSGANGALPWIVFQRDRSIFESRFPSLKIRTLKPIMPFRYLVSGGVSMRTLMPGFLTPLWRGLEACLTPFNDALAMFAFIVLEKTDSLTSSAARRPRPGATWQRANRRRGG